MDQLGGYRIVRRLGSGPRAELLLARTDGETESEASVAIKHYRDDVDDASITTEIEALARAAGDHAVELLDITAAPSGALALILDRLPGGSLGRLLAQRPTLDPGEVPTLLAPLGGLVDRLHAAGVVHRGIRLESVLFDRAGAPVLACFGRAELIAPGLPPAAMDEVAGARADQRAVAAIAAAVLDRAQDFAPARDLIEWLTSSSEPGYRPGWGSELAQRALELAPALPIDFAPPALAIEQRIPGRIPLDTRARLAPSAERGRGRRRSPNRASSPEPAASAPVRTAAVPVEEPWFRGIPPDAATWTLDDEVGAPEPVAQAAAISVPTAPFAPEPWRSAPSPAVGSRTAAKPALDAAGTPDWVSALLPGDWFARARASLAAVRAPVWIAAGLVGAALAAAIVFIPQEGSGAAAEDEPSATPSPIATEPGHGWTPSGGPATDPVDGDDPVLALVSLLEARQRCLDDRSVLCLDVVGQFASAALAEDQQLVRALQEGAETPQPFEVDAEQVTLVERLGDTALLEIAGVAETQPASILLMRTEAGWRIRDYVS